MSELQKEFLEVLYKTNYDIEDYSSDENDWEDFVDHLSITPAEVY